MTFSLLLLSGLAAALLILLTWNLRTPRKIARPGADPLQGEEFARRHVIYFPQVRQALAEEDFAFLASRGSRVLSRRIRKERQRIALAYLSFVRNDFLKLWRLARVITSLSPKVGTAQEIERLRLGLIFYLRYEMIRFKFLFGFAPLPELGSLSDVVSGLSIRLEAAMTDLGERAALAAKLASSLDGRGLGTP